MPVPPPANPDATSPAPAVHLRAPRRVSGPTACAARRWPRCKDRAGPRRAVRCAAQRDCAKSRRPSVVGHRLQSATSALRVGADAEGVARRAVRGAALRCISCASPPLREASVSRRTSAAHRWERTQGRPTGRWGFLDRPQFTVWALAADGPLPALVVGLVDRCHDPAGDVRLPRSSHPGTDALLECQHLRAGGCCLLPETNY